MFVNPLLFAQLLWQAMKRWEGLRLLGCILLSFVLSYILIIVDLRINETLQIGAAGNSAYQVRGESVYLFLEFTIVISWLCFVAFMTLERYLGSIEEASYMLTFTYSPEQEDK